MVKPVVVLANNTSMEVELDIKHNLLFKSAAERFICLLPIDAKQMHRPCTSHVIFTINSVSVDWVVAIISPTVQQTQCTSRFEQGRTLVLTPGSCVK